MKRRGLSVTLCAAMAIFPLVRYDDGDKPVETTTVPTAAKTATAAADTTAAPEKSETRAEAEAKDDAASDDLITTGYTQVGAKSNRRTANTESFESTFTEENGYRLIFDDAQQKQESQIKAVRSFIQQGVDYIVVAPVVETGRETALQEIQEADIPVILPGRQMDVDESLYECWVGDDFIKEGETAGNWLADYLKAQRRDGRDINIVTLQGTIGASAQVGRMEGFGNVLKQHDNWKMLNMQTGESTQAKDRGVMESFLKSYDDVDVVVAENDNMAFDAIDTIKAAGRTCGPDSNIIIFSFDTVRAAFDAVVAGDLNATFECNPLHEPCVDEIIKKLEEGETAERIQYVDETYFDTSIDLESIRTERAY